MGLMSACILIEYHSKLWNEAQYWRVNKGRLPFPFFSLNQCFTLHSSWNSHHSDADSAIKMYRVRMAYQLNSRVLFESPESRTI